MRHCVSVVCEFGEIVQDLLRVNLRDSLSLINVLYRSC